MRIVKYVAIIIACTIIQTSILPNLKTGRVILDLPLILTIYFGLFEGAEAGILMGFFLGFFQDFFSGSILGLQAFSKGLAGFVVGNTSGRLMITSQFVQILYLAIISIGEGLFKYLILRIFHFHGIFRDIFINVIIPQALLNIIIGVLIINGIVWLMKIRRV